MRTNANIEHGRCYIGQDGELYSPGLDRGYRPRRHRRWGVNQRGHGTYSFWRRVYDRRGNRLDGFNAGDYSQASHVIGGVMYNVPVSVMYPE